jgi:regulator of protease activity HflC (stomatin/prohibitin superfamily)
MFENFAKSSGPRFRVSTPPGLQKVRLRFGRLVGLLLVALLPLLLIRACVFTYVPPDQIGLRQISVGSGRGLQKNAVASGWSREISGYETVRTFPRDIQVVEFTNNSAESSADHRQVPAVRVPTVDGYPVDVDVTVLYRIADPYKVASRFGFGNGYEQQVVIRFTDPLVKEHLGELLAEQFYGTARLVRVQALKVALGQRFAESGLRLVDVLIRQYDYPETFQALTEQKKIQDQTVLAQRELTKQAEVQTRLNQVSAEGENLINVKTSEFEAMITEINARKELYERQRRAEADLLVRTAEANGTQAINRAIEGPGSAKLLRLRRGLALLNSIKGPIYISEDPTDLGHIVTGGN